MIRTLLTSLLAVTSSVAAQPRPPIMARLMDVTRVQGADNHTLYGMGLVTGLKLGDSAKAAREMIVNFLKRMGHNRLISSVATGGIAMVMVKVTVPPFAKTGMKLDVIVSTINDAKSLQGGMLEITQLQGTTPNGVKIAGVATGRVYVGGASHGTTKASVTRNHPTVGTAIGACKLTVPPRSFYLNDRGDLELRFLKPSIAAVLTAVDGINKLVKTEGFEAQIVDQYLLRIAFPEDKQTEAQAVRLLYRLHDMPVATTRRATVIIDESTGIILAGEGVQISPCAFALGDIHVSIVSELEVSQPLPGINRGRTAVVSRTRIDVNTENSAPQAIRGGATVEELVKNLSALKLTPLQLINVFQKLDVGGYLHAELEYR